MADFETGVFKPYRFTSKVHLGSIQQDIPEGTIIEYDGSTMRWAEQTYTIPQLQAGIRAGWLVPAADTTSIYRPQPAGVRVRPAQSAGQDRGEPMQMEEASEEEQVVGTVDGARERRDAAQKAGAVQVQRPVAPAPAPAPVAAPFEDAPDVMDVEMDATPVPETATVTVSEPVPVEIDYQTPAPPPAPVTTPQTTNVGRKMEVISDSAGNEGAEPVARIMTPAKQRTVVTDSSAAAHAVSQLDNKPPPKPQKIANAAAPVPETPLAPAPRAPQDIKTPGPGGATGDVSVARTGDDLADLLPDAASSPLPPPTPNINWDRNIHWRSRVQKAIQEFGDSPAALRQILSQETPNVAKHIRSELARAGKQVE